MWRTSPSRVVHHNMSSGPHVSSHGMWTPDTRLYSVKTVSSRVQVVWAWKGESMLRVRAEARTKAKFFIKGCLGLSESYGAPRGKLAV